MKQPNLVLVMCDDLGYGDVGLNGNTIIRTPNLDALAKQGVRLDRFYAGGPVCSPTRGTCLTGRHYIRYGINHANEGRLPVEERSLGNWCGQHGYRTGHFGKWHLGTLTRTEQDGRRGNTDSRFFSPPWVHGFDTCFSTESKVPTWDPARVPSEMMKGVGQKWGVPGEPWKTAYWNERGERVSLPVGVCDSELIMDHAEKFIRAALREDRSFLSVIWFHAPHTPVVAGPEWRRLYCELSEEEQHYFGCISAMDAQMGRLENLLKETGAWENTLLHFCSDNGPEGMGIPEQDGRCRGGTGGLRGRKRSLYEGGVGVPAFICWPKRFDKDQVSTTPFSTLDLLPTCAEAMQTELPGDRPLDGISMLPYLTGEADQRLASIPYRFLDSERKMFGSPTCAWISGKWKFLTNLDGDASRDQLFNLDVDRKEEKNCAGQYPVRCAAFRTEIKEWLRSCRNSHAGNDYDTPVDMITPFQEPGGWK